VNASSLDFNVLEPKAGMTCYSDQYPGDINEMSTRAIC
jgi:hypothetical protein